MCSDWREASRSLSKAGKIHRGSRKDWSKDWSWVTISKELRTSILQPRKLNSAGNLKEHGSRFILRASGKECVSVDTLIFRLVRLVGLLPTEL